MFQTLANAWKIPDLRKKILFTAFIIVIYRIGANIPVPFVDSHFYAQGLIPHYINLIIDIIIYIAKNCKMLSFIF